MTGLIVPPGRGRRIHTGAQDVTFKVTGEHSRAASSFEVVVPPGFDVGAHVHTRSEELFYVIDGELDLLAFEPRERTGNWREWENDEGERVIRAGPGSVMFVPPGCPHAFANPGKTDAKMFFQSSPPTHHEHYFEELLEILDAPGPVDHAAIAELRIRSDIEQLTPLQFG
ncbi:cupin domain-containing protein [Saccharopolyspora flava]|uniref:1,3,6,8-tetrahydroxynaphthalene monooxygenase n=1 Tax=Saccharopolyspora flava TaxID=95161 RepID=A0A1I6PPF8_9PSEU|nr:cupin domain-containing protein [Saccharopolyspora flava]SFS42074.1 1,3,6,8-tetrahydroxynaphthalene monooxygenase [Saccharopolyspora flava]